jgi:hypothetical protein
MPVDSLSVGGPCSFQLCHFKLETGGGGASLLYGLPPVVTPGGVGCKPCGVGPPLMWPDGVGVVKAAEAGSFDDEDVDGRGESVVLSDSLPSLALKKVGFRSAGVFSLAFLGLFGPLAPVVPVLGYHGRPLYFPSLPWRSLNLGAVYGADAEESERGSPLVRWVSGSGPHGSFHLAFWGPLGLWRL